MIGVPPGLEDFPDFPTKSTFEKCVGHEFVVDALDEIGAAELNISSVTGSYGEKIWIEPRFLTVIRERPAAQ